jgi:hypothetical protein
MELSATLSGFHASPLATISRTLVQSQTERRGWLPTFANLSDAILRTALLPVLTHAQSIFHLS